MVSALTMPEADNIEALRTQIWQQLGTKLVLEHGGAAVAPSASPPTNLMLRYRDFTGERAQEGEGDGAGEGEGGGERERERER